MTDRTAILGWGSLLWDKRPDFDTKHEPWLEDGPILPLEFSRISDTRLGALTLVIDSANGQECKVSYAMSRRRDPRDAVCDLRSREGTVLDKINWFRAGDKAVISTSGIFRSLSAWAIAAKVDIVVWTALSSNFAEKKNGMPFSVENAIAHLQALDPKAKVMAAEYILRAPSFVNTPLRRALQGVPWFEAQSPPSRP